MREIFGWNEAEVGHARKNLAYIYGFSAMNTTNPNSTRYLTNAYGTTINTKDFTWPDTKLVITQD